MEALRTELQKTHHLGRIHKMLELGRRAHDDPRALAVLDSFAKGDVFERRMALFAEHTHHDGARVLAFTRDVSRSLRLLAFSLVPAACTDDQVFEALKIAF